MTAFLTGAEISLPPAIVLRAVEHWLNHALRDPVDIVSLEIVGKTPDEWCLVARIADGTLDPDDVARVTMGDDTLSVPAPSA